VTLKFPLMRVDKDLIGQEERPKEVSMPTEMEKIIEEMNAFYRTKAWIEGDTIHVETVSGPSLFVHIAVRDGYTFEVEKIGSYKLMKRKQSYFSEDLSQYGFSL
jgi:hypothetical protein